MIIFRQKEYTTKTIRVYHTTKIENLQSIFKYGLLLKYQKDRDFENKALGLNLKNKGVIYLSKTLDYLCIPAKENKRVVLQIDIPEDIYKKWDKVNKGDPMRIELHKRFNNLDDAMHFMMNTMRKQDSKLDQAVKEDILKYGTLENTPRYKHAIISDIAMDSDHTLCISENIPPEWICSDILTETQLRKMGKYAPIMQ